MKNNEELTHYICEFLDLYNDDFVDDIKINNILLLLSIYKSGLLNEDFPLYKILSGNKLDDTPFQFHQLIGHLLILNEKKDLPNDLNDYLYKSVEKDLDCFKQYYLKN